MEDIAWAKEDSAKSQHRRSVIKEDMSLPDEEDIASQILLPNLNFYTELHYKEADRNYKALIKLLQPKSTKSKKSFPKTREQVTNTTLQERLTEVYLKSQRRNTIIKQNNFMKSDFLKELVMKEDLKCLVLEIRAPQNQCFYLIDNVRVPANIEGDLYDDIQNEMLSIALYEDLFKMMTLYSTDINDFLYDYHIILNLRKYFSKADHAQPLYSIFILLKPTNMLLKKLSNPPEDNDSSNTLVPPMERLREESKIISEVSGPLYLDVSPMAKEFINFLKEYRHDFDSAVSYQKPLKDCLGFEINLSPLLQYIMRLNCNSELKKYNQLLNSIMGLPLRCTGTCIPTEESWRKVFKEFLKERKFEKPEKDLFNEYKLIEMFTVKFSRSYTNKVPDQRFISVFYNHDGTFKFCLTTRLFMHYIPRYPEALFIKDGCKEALDSFIFEVLSCLDRISTCGLKVTYSNFTTNGEGKFYTGDKNDIEKMNKESKCCFQEAAFPDARKRYLDACGYSDTVRNNFIRRQVLVNGTLRNAFVKYKKTPYIIDSYLKLRDQKYNRKPLEIEAGLFVENHGTRTAFEAHQFEKSKRYPFKTHEENGDKIEYEFYPSLSQTYNCTEKDFLDGNQLVLTNDMKNFLDRVRKGDVRPYY